MFLINAGDTIHVATLKKEQRHQLLDQPTNALNAVKILYCEILRSPPTPTSKTKQCLNSPDSVGEINQMNIYCIDKFYMIRFN